jgi:HSP20 family protein
MKSLPVIALIGLCFILTFSLVLAQQTPAKQQQQQPQQPQQKQQQQSSNKDITDTDFGYRFPHFAYHPFHDLMHMRRRLDNILHSMWHHPFFPSPPRDFPFWSEFERPSLLEGSEQHRHHGGSSLDVYNPLQDLTPWSPRADFSEMGDRYNVHVDLPGIEQDKVKLSVQGRTLTLKGEGQQEKEEEGKQWHIKERTRQSFQSSFTLPSNANTDAITASFKNGVLDITVPKKEKTESRKIDIKSANE